MAIRDLRGTQVRRALLGNQLYLLEGMGVDDAAVDTAVKGIGRDLAVIDRALARAKADPSRARLRAEVAVMRPAIRRMIVRIKELYDAKEQEFFGALSGTLEARTGSECLLVGLSGLVLVVGLALALSLRPPGHPRLPGRPGLPLRPAAAHRGHNGPAGKAAVR